nr:17-beta-hydroxysteroid dehydrogenase type 3 [Anolis sagrei ordinatus]
MGEFQQHLLTVLGSIVCLVFLVKSLRFLKYVFPYIRSTLPPSFFQSMGEWAVITGAGDGIGRAYSIELAKRGLNIVLISRTFQKMQRVALDIEQTTGQRVKIIQADFTKMDIYSDIEKSLQGLEVGILVNNVGMLQTSIPCHFLDAPNNDQALINCNIMSVTQMTRIILKQMVPRQRGLILNISSAVGTFPCPLYAIYSASKAFGCTFSKALQAEYNTKGIIIQAVTPYSVSTPMTMWSKPNLINKTAEDFVRESLEYITLGDETFGCLAHEILARLVQCIPLQIFHSERVQNMLKDAISGRLKKNSNST